MCECDVQVSVTKCGCCPLWAPSSLSASPPTPDDSVSTSKTPGASTSSKKDKKASSQGIWCPTGGVPAHEENQVGSCHTPGPEGSGVTGGHRGSELPGTLEPAPPHLMDTAGGERPGREHRAESESLIPSWCSSPDHGKALV